MICVCREWGPKEIFAVSRIEEIVLTVFTDNGIKSVKVVSMSALSIKSFPDEIHREAKAAAARAGVTLQAWILEAIKEKLERTKL